MNHGNTRGDWSLTTQWTEMRWSKRAPTRSGHIAQADSSGHDKGKVTAMAGATRSGKPPSEAVRAKRRAAFLDAIRRASQEEMVAGPRPPKVKGAEPIPRGSGSQRVSSRSAVPPKPAKQPPSGAEPMTFDVPVRGRNEPIATASRVGEPSAVVEPVFPTTFAAPMRGRNEPIATASGADDPRAAVEPTFPTTFAVPGWRRNEPIVTASGVGEPRAVIEPVFPTMFAVPLRSRTEPMATASAVDEPPAMAEVVLPTTYAVPIRTRPELMAPPSRDEGPRALAERAVPAALAVLASPRPELLVSSRMLGPSAAVAEQLVSTSRAGIAEPRPELLGPAESVRPAPETGTGLPAQCAEAEPLQAVRLVDPPRPEPATSLPAPPPEVPPANGQVQVFAVPAKQLYELLRALPERELNQLEGGLVTIRVTPR
jgi:hypothetical protein